MTAPTGDRPPTFEELLLDPMEQFDRHSELLPAILRQMSETPIEIRLCDDAGLVSDEPVEPGSPGLVFDPELTYRKLLNNLRSVTGLPPYVDEPFFCSGSAHLAAQVFHCTSPAHKPPAGHPEVW